MIIIETANGDRFINEAEVRAVSHNKEHCFVAITYNDGTTMNAFQVKRMYYTNKTDVKIDDDGRLLEGLRSDVEYFKQLNQSAEQVVERLDRQRNELENFILNYIGKPDEPYAKQKIDDIKEAREKRSDYCGDELRHFRTNTGWYPKLREDSREKGEETAKEFARLTAEIKRLDEMHERDKSVIERICKRSLWERITNKYAWV